MKWNPSTDRILLLAILETHKIVIDYEAVAREIGNGCTASAVYQQVHKLKRLAQNNNPEMGNKPIAYRKPRGGTKKGYFDNEEETKEIKPMPSLRQKIKIEQLEAVVEEKQVVIKQEGQQETKMSSSPDRDVIIIP